MTTGKKTLSGKFNTWAFGGSERSYAEISMPFSEASKIAVATPFNAMTGRGEQRIQFESHVNALSRAIESGTYTPTQFCVHLYDRHRANLEKHPDTNTFKLEVDYASPLALTDGGHRMSSLQKLLAKYIKERDTAKTEKDKKAAQAIIDSIEALPIGFRIYLDGSPKTDFINLQSGRSVDKATILSMQLQQKVIKDEFSVLAYRVLKELNTNAASPLAGLIQFDSNKKKAKGSVLNLIPVNTLFQKGSSDLAFSTLGLARVGKSFKPEVLANLFIRICDEMSKEYPWLVAGGHILALPKNGGSKGSVTLLMALAVCLAYRLATEGREATEDDIKNVAASAEATLNVEIDGSFSNSDKRKYAGGFAQWYFADMKVEKHEEIPVGLLKILSCSTFKVESFPKKGGKDVATTEDATLPVIAPSVSSDTAPIVSAGSDGMDEEEVTTESLAEQLDDKAYAHIDVGQNGTVVEEEVQA